MRGREEDNKNKNNSGRPNKWSAAEGIALLSDVQYAGVKPDLHRSAMLLRTRTVLILHKYYRLR
jgi:hypothetical protein